MTASYKAAHYCAMRMSVGLPGGSRSPDVDNQARAYLADLQEEHTFLQEEHAPTWEPQENEDWAVAFLVAFRQMRDLQCGKEIQRAAERFGQSTGADRYRFSWEFWQN